MNTVQCPTHGAQARTYVCQHIIQTLRDRQPRGFFYGGDAPTDRGDAWCAACDAMLTSSGGDWHEEIEAKAGISLLCAACYDEAKCINGL
jgi:hypothetical protein